MYNSEYNKIFEQYINVLLNENDVALQSKFGNILNVLEQENITDPIIFFNRAHTLINRLPTTNASKASIILHLKKAQESGLDAMKEYFRKAAGFYERGGFINKKAVLDDKPVYHDPGWNKPPSAETLAMHVGDVVKYVGPSHIELNPHDDYMIVRKEDRGPGRITFYLRLYNKQKANVNDPRELEKKIINPNYIRKIGNNLEDKQRNSLRIHANDIDTAKKREQTADKFYKDMAKDKINKSTRFTRTNI